jgi:hypothetical protein
MAGKGKGKDKDQAPPAPVGEATKIQGMATTTTDTASGTDAVLPKVDVPDTSNDFALAVMLSYLLNTAKKNADQGMPFTVNVNVCLVALSAFGITGLLMVDRFSSKIIDLYNTERERYWNYVTNMTSTSCTQLLNTEKAILPKGIDYIWYIGLASISAMMIYGTYKFLSYTQLHTKTNELMQKGLDSYSEKREKWKKEKEEKKKQEAIIQKRKEDEIVRKVLEEDARAQIEAQANKAKADREAREKATTTDTTTTTDATTDNRPRLDISGI